jgi:hypothetical protein
VRTHLGLRRGASLAWAGTITAPAGCGKTQLIADSLKTYVHPKPVLVLTHTNAGKGPFESSSKYKDGELPFRARLGQPVNCRRNASATS